MVNSWWRAESGSKPRCFPFIPWQTKTMTFPAAGRPFEEVLFLFETVPVLSSAEKTSWILESLQQSFEKFAVRIIYARGVCRHLQHLFSSFFLISL